MRVPRSDGLLPDRFVEVDLDWFEPGERRPVEEFVERVGPLLDGARELRGVVLNPGFLVDVITEFDGDARMHLPMRSRRYDRWSSHTYADLRALVDDLRAVASRRGIDDLRVGLFVAGVGRVITGGDMYDLASDWCDRHPEMYPLDVSPLPGPDLDPRVPLAADDHRYASRPGGIVGGTPFAEFLADQWAAVAATCALDVLHLRDGFWGPMLYTRRGPYGVVASDDVAENTSWTTAVGDVFVRVKEATPEAIVMAYTSGIGATAEWRSGCVDSEAVLARGGVDVLIDQTWGGAWQDWWDDWWKGWTNQHANLLSHAVAVRGVEAPVRHYKLIETWDGWEPFDTVHAVPEKLRWAMWAWSHAAVVTPDGLEVPDGSYISWMNDKDRRLLDTAAIRFVADNLDEAERSASRMTAVGGPLLVFDRASVERLHAESPRERATEHVEDAAALLLKWGTPILGATRAEWIDEVSSGDGAVVQLGNGISSVGDVGGATMTLGRADVASASLLAAAGVEPTGASRRSGYHREVVACDTLPSDGWVHLAGDAETEPAAGTDVVVTSAGWPTLAGTTDAAWWQPPDLADPSNPLLPRSQYGSVASAAAAARWWSRRGGRVAVDHIAFHQPATIQWWSAGDELWLLAGNLEAGTIGDSRTTRTVHIWVDGASGPHEQCIEIPAEGCVVTRLLQSEEHVG